MPLRQHMTYANVTASIALFVALGGGATAALSVTGRSVTNGSLTGADIKKGSLTGDKIKPGSLTGTNIKTGSVKSEDVSGLKTADFAKGALAPITGGLKQAVKGDKGDKGEPGPIDGKGAGGVLAGTFPNPTIKPGAVQPEALAEMPGARANGFETSLGAQADFGIDLAGEAYDTGDMYESGDDFITVKRAGTYLVTGYITWNGGGNVERQIRFVVNTHNSAGIFHLVDETNTADLFLQDATTIRRFAAGDKVYLGSYQDSGAAANTTTMLDARVSLALQWMGP